MSTRTRNRNVGASHEAEETQATTQTLEAPLEETHEAAPQDPISVRLFDELRGIVASSDAQTRANITVLGGRRYDSGNSRPSATGGRAAPIFYPYLFAKNIFPQTARTPQAKLDFIRAEMLSKPDEKKTQLLAVDLSKLLSDGGIKLPNHLHPQSVKDTILNSNEEVTNNEEQVENLF